MFFNLINRIKEAVSPSPIPPWIRVAQREIGVKEVPGPGSNSRIIEYNSATTLKSTDDAVAWCSSFVNWVCMKCNLERSHSAAARSWLGYGKRLPGFKKYSIVVFRRGNSSWQGHVAFAMEDLGSHIRCLGGNQGDKVGYASYPKANVLAFQWPVPEEPVTLIHPLT